MAIVGIIVGALGSGAALFAAWVSRKALAVSRRLLDDAERESDRNDRRRRMRGLHELYDSLEGIRGAFEARNPIVWVARQQWLRTLLAETGSDDHLPNTRLLSDLAFPEGASEMTALRALLPNCRQEILALLEVEANDARAALSSRSKGSAVRAS